MTNQTNTMYYFTKLEGTPEDRLAIRSIDGQSITIPKKGWEDLISQLKLASLDHSEELDCIKIVKKYPWAAVVFPIIASKPEFEELLYNTNYESECYQEIEDIAYRLMHTNTPTEEKETM